MVDEAMVELKPCPFCGSTTATVFRPTCDRNSSYDPSDRACPIVRCMSCYTDVAGDVFDASCQSARDKWNRRAALADTGKAETLPVAWLGLGKIYRNRLFSDRQMAQTWLEERDGYGTGREIVPLYTHPPRSALVQPAPADAAVVERISTEAAMSQWERSRKRPDLREQDRVRGAIEAYKRQAFAFSILALPTSNTGVDGSAISTTDNSKGRVE